MNKIIFFIFLCATFTNCWAEDLPFIDSQNNPEKIGALDSKPNSVDTPDILPASSADLKAYEQNSKQFTPDKLLSIAFGYVYANNFARAITVYNSILANQPTNVLALRGLGNCYAMNTNIDMAIALFKKASELGDDLSLLALADEYVVSKRTQEIVPLIPKLVELRKRSTDDNVKHEITNILLMYSLDADPPTNREIFTMAMKGLSDEFVLERDDTSQLAVYSLSFFGDADRAARLNAQIDNQKRCEGLQRAALQKYEARDFGAAIDAFSEIIQKEPGQSILYYDRACAEVMVFKDSEALRDYNEAIEITPNFGFAFNNRGNLRLRLGDFDGATSDLNEAIKLLPDYFGVYQNLGDLKIAMLKWGEALKYYKLAVQHLPSESAHMPDASRFSVWVAQSRLGDRAGAKKDMVEYLNSSSGTSRDIWSMKTGEFLSDALGDNAFLAAAKETAVGADQLNAQTCSAFFYLGEKKLLSGDKLAAARSFQKSLDTGENHMLEYLVSESELKASKDN